MGEPKQKPEPERHKYGPHPKDRELFEDPALDEPLNVDVDAHLRWLETGEGEPWPERSS
jgi:hypothetical protein